MIEELDRRAITGLVVSHHSPAVSPPGPETTSLPAKEKCSLTDLASLGEVVDVVIGVDTHAAAVVDVRTGAVLDEIIIETTTCGYARLVAFADQHARLRADLPISWVPSW